MVRQSQGQLKGGQGTVTFRWTIVRFHVRSEPADKDDTFSCSTGRGWSSRLCQQYQDLSPTTCNPHSANWTISPAVSSIGWDVVRLKQVRPNSPRLPRRGCKIGNEQQVRVLRMDDNLQHHMATLLRIRATLNVGHPAVGMQHPRKRRLGRNKLLPQRLVDDQDGRRSC